MNQYFDIAEHRPAMAVMFGALRGVFGQRQFADKAIEQALRAEKITDGDIRGLVVETTYDIIRYWRLLQAMMDIDATQPLNEGNLFKMVSALRVMAGHAEVRGLSAADLGTAKLRLHQLRAERKMRESIPDWLDELGAHELGVAWDDVLHALNEKPSTFLRANALKTTPANLQKILADEGMADSKLVDWSADAVQLQDYQPVFASPAFHEGLFEVQDAASQCVAGMLDVRPGMRVVDACAGRGGKTLHLAALMGNRGRVIALDVSQDKLQQLKKRAARAGAQIIETRWIETTKVVKRLRDGADRLLLDVPCSGLGVLRRNPDARWHLTPDDITRLRELQREIMTRYANITRSGGKMVYSTCSILPSEGEEQVRWFLRQTEGKWTLLEERRYSPHLHNSDGFYMALLQRSL